MKFGVTGCNVATYADPEPSIAMAQAAEAAGVESLWTYEHIVFPAGFASKYPYSVDGSMGIDPATPMTDPLSWVSMIAGVTKTIKLATGVIILPEHNPVQLAKRAATIDRLAGGRLLLGVGVGWMKEEFAALGVPFERRGARMDEYLDAMRLLWTEDEPSFDGEFVSYERAICQPKPVHPGGVHVIVGGHSDAAARRSGRRAQGFYPVGDADRLEAQLATMRRAAEDASRDPDAIEITLRGPVPGDPELEQYAEAGVSRLMIHMPTYDPSQIDDKFGELGEQIAPYL